MVMSVGLDLSLTASGVVRSDGRLLLVGEAGITNMPIAGQIHALDSLAKRILRHVLYDETGLPHDDELGIVVIEALDMAHGYGGSIERTILWWKVVEEIHSRGVRVAVATSAHVKMFATGSGVGPKGAVIEAVTRRWPHFAHGGNDNLADAATLAMIGQALLGEPHGLPASHTRALEKVRGLEIPPARVLKRGAK